MALKALIIESESESESVWGSGRGRAYGVWSVMAKRREREAEKHWRRERKRGRKEEGGPSNGNKLGPHKKIESGFESSLDSKTGQRVFSNLVWDPHKIQVGISILT